MRNLSRGLIVSLLFSLISIPAFAAARPNDIKIKLPQIQQAQSDEAVVRVIPNEARQGANHTILVTSLEANEIVNIQIIEEASGNPVYTVDETANDRGIIEVEIFTEAEDNPGTYSVEVTNASGTVIGTDEFEVLAVEIFMPEISLSPQESEIGETVTVEITGARPFVVLELVIENEADEDVFEQALRASVDGAAVFEFESTPEMAGIATVTVIENEETNIFEQEITVLGQRFPATVTIEPNELLPGDTVYVTVSGLEPETDIQIDISFDDAVIETLQDTANISGLVAFPYTFADSNELGRYDISVYQNSELVGQQRVDLAILPVGVTVTPEVGTVGTVFFVSVNDLRPDEEIRVDFIFDGEVLQSRTTFADAEGIARTALGQRIDLELGMYMVEVYRMDTLMETQSVEIAEARPPTPTTTIPEDVTISIVPESGEIPTVYSFTVEGLPSEQAITLSILFEGESVFSLDGTANADGLFTTELTSEDGDTPGTYTAGVSIDGTTVASAEFAIGEPSTSESESDTEDEGLVIEGDIQLDIVPVILRQGERVEFFIRDLEPGDVITFDLFFEGNNIYSVQAIADSNGVATTALVARDNEIPGTYQVEIMLDGEIVAANTFEVVEADAVIDNAEITVVPVSGAQGTEYTISASGLSAGETVDIEVSLSGSIVFEAERTADDNGNVSITLNSDETDTPGTYDVTVSRDANDDLTAVFDITEGSVATSPPDDSVTSEATITIEPMAGAIGTQHMVTVTGLNPDEAFTLNIVFDGETVYSADQTADENGDFSTAIAAGEDDPLGEYLVVIDRQDSDDLSETLTVTGEDDEQVAPPAGELTIEIVPDEVAGQEPFDLIVSGLEEGESVDITIEFDGDVVFETDRAANAEGQVILNLATDPGDPTGTYTITVRRGMESVSADVIIIGDQVETPPAVEPTSGIEITVEPTTGDIGTSYEFFVSGLGSNEEFDIDVATGGETVFEATRTADASGFFTITLETSESDTPGTYTFTVIRDGVAVESIDFEVGDASVGAGDDQTQQPDEPDESANIPDEPETVAAQITYADGVEITFNEDTTVQVVEFEASAGDVISVNVDSGDTLDTVATLFTPAGVIVTSDDDGGLGLDPEIERAVLPDNGTYRLEVRPFNVGDTGTATVTINRDDVRTLDGNEPRIVILNSKITADILTFEGVAGEVISLIVELDEGDVGALVITAEQSDNLLMNYQTFGLPQVIVLGFVVPEDGTVVIRMEDDGSTASKLDTSIERE